MKFPRTLVALLALTVLAGCLDDADSGTPAATVDGTEADPDPSETPTTFEGREPSGTCGNFDSLEPIVPNPVLAAGLATGWPLLQLDVAMIADPSFQDAHPDDWEELLAELVADANVHYEEQLGIRWNISLTTGLPNGSLEAGTHDGQQRAVARGFLAEHHPGAEWDIVAVILGSDYEGAVAGEVECVHGLAYKDYAFLWSEYQEERGGRSLAGTPIGLLEDMPLKVFMHEAAHLLAAHHHYTNCGLPLSDLRTSDAAGVCGTMINDIGLASFRFSETNKLVMRSFVEQLGVADPVSA